MCLKCGDEISAQDCCILHGCVLEAEKDADANLKRFSLGNDPVPPEMTGTPCVHQRPKLAYRTAGFSVPINRLLPRNGARKAFTFSEPLPRTDGDEAIGYLASWSYFSRRTLVACRVVIVDGLAHIQPRRPGEY